jgi:hypothetical protein
MNTIDIKPLVEQAIATQWPAFVESHPHLAQVLDETLLLESATAHLNEDPDYQEALQHAAAAGLAAETLGGLVTQLIQKFLQRLA